MNWKTKRTARGFQVIDFLDHNGEKCSLQQSSAVLDYEDSMERPGTSAVWFGDNKNRMHLDQDQVLTLRGYLGHWLEYGCFRVDEED